MKKLVYILGGLTLIFLISLLYPQKSNGKSTKSELSIEQKISRQRENAIVKAVERAEKAVISITCMKTGYVKGFSPFFKDPFFKEFFGELFPPRYYRQRIISQGSGFIISKDGYIFTNEHVIAEADTIKVTLPDGRIFDAKLIGKDKDFDIALLKIEGKNLPHVTIGNSDSLKRGEWVIAFGNPFGYLWDDPQPTITVGVISALHRNFKGSENREYKNLIQTDAAINPGNSGGPLCNADGNVIGMNTFIITKSGGFEGIGFAIPVNLLNKCIEHLVKYGRIKKGELEIEVSNINSDLRHKYGVNKNQGVVVVHVEKDGPCAKILREGDLIKKINGHLIRNKRDYEIATYDLLEKEKVGVLFERNGKEIFKTVEAVQPEKVTKLGIRIDNIDDYFVKKYNLKVKQGVVITEVKPGSFADEMGLREGDVIIGLNGKGINNKKDFEKILSKVKDYIEMLIIRGNTKFYLEYRIG